MTTIYQTKSPSLANSTEQNKLTDDNDLSKTPLDRLLDEAFSGGDQLRGGDQPSNNDFDDAVNFSSPGPLPGIMRHPLINNPFTQSKVGGTPLSAVLSNQQVETRNYTVKSGETLSSVAAANNLSLDEMIALNPQIKNIEFVKPGDSIVVPARLPTGARS